MGEERRAAHETRSRSAGRPTTRRGGAQGGPRDAGEERRAALDTRRPLPRLRLHLRQRLLHTALAPSPAASTLRRRRGFLHTAPAPMTTRLCSTPAQRPSHLVCSVHMRVSLWSTMCSCRLPDAASGSSPNGFLTPHAVPGPSLRACAGVARSSLRLRRGPLLPRPSAPLAPSWAWRRALLFTHAQDPTHAQEPPCAGAGLSAGGLRFKGARASHAGARAPSRFMFSVRFSSLASKKKSKL